MRKIYIICLFLIIQHLQAQTEIDGIMMDKNNFCTGVNYDYSSWDEYWEGSFKRENLNLGVVSTQKIIANGNYGITNKLNAIFSIPYIKTNATAGTLLGQKGFQDLSLTLKYLFYEKESAYNSLTFYALGGYSFPISNYVADYLPLSIGLQSKVSTIRLMGDYQFGQLFTTISGAYLNRSNIKIDRTSYFTNEMHYSNIVDMPNVVTFNFRAGYRTNKLIAEIIFESWITQKGGFDITSNNNPFPSNTQNFTKIGFNGKYYIKQIPNLSIILGLNHVINGRNVGQSNAINTGLFYILNFKSNKAKNEN